MPDEVAQAPPRKHGATQFLLKGLAITLPPILTLVILIWIARGVNDYIIQPISTVVRFGFAQLIDRSESIQLLDTLPELPPLPYCDKNYRITPEERKRLMRFLKLTKADSLEPHEVDLEQVYVPVGDGKRAVPYQDYALVAAHVKPIDMPNSVIGIYMEVVTLRQPLGLVGLSAVGVSLTVIILYYVGRIGTARVGAWGVSKFENLFLGKLPLISNVYSSVKQVTDFLFTDRTVNYNRVVAVEYPRRGVWSLGFVTGESMLQITAAAGEPLVSVLVPTSPAPFTGFTISVPRSEVLDLNMTIDQAFQFCISCGVHVPPQQRVTAELLQQELARRLAGTDRPVLPRAAEEHPPSPPQPSDGRPDDGQPAPDQEAPSS